MHCTPFIQLEIGDKPRREILREIQKVFQISASKNLI